MKQAPTKWDCPAVNTGEGVFPSPSPISLPEAKSTRMDPSPEIPETVATYCEPLPVRLEIVPVAVPFVKTTKSSEVTFSASSSKSKSKSTEESVDNAVPSGIEEIKLGAWVSTSGAS